VAIFAIRSVLDKIDVDALGAPAQLRRYAASSDLKNILSFWRESKRCH
jgi:hypothetical protein